MSKAKLTDHENNWLLAIGTLKGFIYLLNITFSDKEAIKIDCLNCLGIEEELAEADSSSTTPTISLSTLKTTGSSKIFNLIWFTYQDSEAQTNRYFLLACFSLLNGLTHLYEYDKTTGQLKLVARLYLPQAQHRWLTSFCIISIRNQIKTDSDILHDDESNSQNESLPLESEPHTKKEEIYLIGGDKCGNLHLYKIEHDKTDSQDDEEIDSKRFKQIKPIESHSNTTKENSSISAIYSKETNNSNFDENLLDFYVICCCKDGFYRLFEFNSGYFESSRDANDSNELEDDDDGDSPVRKQTIANKVQDSKSCMLKIVNKFQINSYIDIIEQFVFEKEAGTTNFDLTSSLLNKLTQKKIKNSESQSFDVESCLKLALCFYGDKFVLWNFQLNRLLFEFRCGGANRSWDFEFSSTNVKHDTNEDMLVFRFFYIKNKCIGEARKWLGRSEIERPFNQETNHLCQVFHGNTITTCKFLASGNHLLTGAEDTQLIVTNIENKSHDLKIAHAFRLQGHDSVVKCVDFIRLNDHELLLVSAGGKANIKLWKVMLETSQTSTPEVNRIIQLCEFKRFLNRRNRKPNANLASSSTSQSQASEKPWLNVDLKSNPDVRFMDVCIFESGESNTNEFIMCFACSDGYVRVFRFLLDAAKLYLVNKYAHNKCLLCLRRLIVSERTFLLGVGTDGSLLIWPLNLTDEDVKCQKIQDINQSGINDLAIWQNDNDLIVATVGDDTRISILSVGFNAEGECSGKFLVKQDMAHASSIISEFMI
jgi:hypothetical protein